MALMAATAPDVRAILKVRFARDGRGSFDTCSPGFFWVTICNIWVTWFRYFPFASIQKFFPSSETL
jgi:hypothetical protein